MTSKHAFALLLVIALLLGFLVLYASAQAPVDSAARQAIGSSAADVELAGTQPASPAAIDATIEPVEAGIACAPATLSYEVEVRNDDTVADTIDISALADNFWPAAVAPASLTLEPGSSGMVDVTVEIPWYATGGDSQALVITADPQLGDPVTQTVRTTAALGAGWEDLTPSLHPASDLAVVYENGYLYQIGGHDSGGYHPGTYRYDILADTWLEVAPMITPTAHMDGAAIEGNIYVPGGEVAGSDWNAFVQVYSTTANLWDTVAPMLASVRHHEVVARNGRLYVLGGETAGGVYTDTVQMYYPGTGIWVEREPMPIPVAHAASGVIGGKIYVAGGFNGTYQSALQIYDPGTNTWSLGQELPTAWVGAADGVKHDRYLILTGGHASDLETTSATGWFYDAANDAWHPLPDPNSSRYGAEGDGDGDEFYYVGGRELDAALVYSGRNEQLVQCTPPAAQARVEAGSLSAPGCPGSTETRSFEVCNDGNAPLQFSIEEIPPAGDLQAPQSPTAVLRDQPATPKDTSRYANQDFEPRLDPGDIFIADDFDNSQWWAINRIYVPGRTWNPEGDLRCADVLHWEIYADAGGVPAGDPWGRGTPPVWTYYSATSDPNVVISAGWAGIQSDVTLNLPETLTLPAGKWWFVFYPSLSLDKCFQYGRRPSETRYGDPAQVINPGGGLEDFYTTWTSVEAISVWHLAPNQEFAFRLEGTTLGDIAWLSQDPPTGAVEGGQCSSVDVLFDATGLTPGTYDAALTVGSSDLSTPSANLPVSLVVREPAEIQDVSYVVDQRQVAFNATATGTEPLGFTWDFGDGNTSSLEDPVHDYAVYQCYAVALTVDNACAEEPWSTKLCLDKPTIYLPIIGRNG